MSYLIRHRSYDGGGNGFGAFGSYLSEANAAAATTDHGSDHRRWG